MSLVASTVRAEVRLVVRADGTKAIYNIAGGTATRGGGRSYRGTDYGWLAKQRNRSTEYDQIIATHSKRYGVDPILVKAVIQVESNFNPRCVSNKGARGLMQLMPETARRFGVSNSLDPEQNIRGGVAYLSLLLRQFSSDLSLVLAAYNAGENAVSRYGGIPPYAETQNYVQKALTVYHGRPHGPTRSGTWIASGGRKTLRGGFMRGGGLASRAALVASAVTPVRAILGSSNGR